MDASLMLVLGLGAIFVALVVAIGTVGTITAERQQVGRSLAAVRSIQAMPNGREAAPPFADRVVAPLVARFARFGRRFSPDGQVERIRARLDAAGSPARWDTDRVLAFKSLGLLGFSSLGLVVSLVFGFGVLPAIGVTIAAAFVGYLAPDLVLYQVGYERREKMQRVLPDALDLLTISVEAGLGFDAALAQVSRNTEGPLAAEFFRVLQEMQIGMSRSDAFRALAERTNLQELRSFVTAVVQADALGIPIANVLRVQSKEMRVRRTQKAEEKAQKVPVKILFPLIFCILPTLFVVVIGPAAIKIIHTFG